MNLFGTVTSRQYHDNMCKKRKKKTKAYRSTEQSVSGLEVPAGTSFTVLHVRACVRACVLTVPCKALLESPEQNMVFV